PAAIAPNSPRVEYSHMASASCRNAAKFVVVDQNQTNLAGGQCTIQRDKFCAGGCERLWQRVDIRFDNLDARAILLSKRNGYLKRRTLAQIIDIRLEGEPEARDLRVWAVFD